tara:strand:- start:800 stop:1015 length:216 start_codon:yes stop_codon:yes gene_type:complete
MNSFVELNKCHVCGKEGNDDEIMLDLTEILECSNKRLEQWQKSNPKIMLYDWFCDPCASKIGNQIESEVVQ